MTYTLKKSGLNIKKSREKNKFSVYKFNSPIFTGLSEKTAKTFLKNQFKREKKLRS